MELLSLTNIASTPGSRKRRKRVGRGIGSGRGKTSTRGQKGQWARNHVRPGFEGGQTPLYRRLPKLRGLSKGSMALGPTRKVYASVNVSDLNRFEAGATVDAVALHAAGILKGQHSGLRVLGNGELKHALTVRAIHFTASAKEKIEAAGGTAEIIEARAKVLS
jgi:large subunit ribosomal protein L15